MRVGDLKLAKVARDAGVSKYLLDSLHQRRTAAPNVHDAILIARHFGESVESFCDGDGDGKALRLKMLLSRLTEPELAALEATLEALVGGRDPVPR